MSARNIKPRVRDDREYCFSLGSAETQRALTFLASAMLETLSKVGLNRASRYDRCGRAGGDKLCLPYEY
jgi:hypothetical protein